MLVVQQSIIGMLDPGCIFDMFCDLFHISTRYSKSMTLSLLAWFELRVM